MNNINDKVLKFKQASDNAISEYHKSIAGTEIKRYQPYPFEHYRIQERIMRIGIEARALQATNEDEYFLIAQATLQDDYIKYSKENL